MILLEKLKRQWKPLHLFRFTDHIHWNSDPELDCTSLLQSKYKKSRDKDLIRTTIADVARKCFSKTGLPMFRPLWGKLTDHYNPVSRTVNLSEGVYAGNSIMAAAVAAHECVMPCSTQRICPAQNAFHACSCGRFCLAGSCGSFWPDCWWSTHFPISCCWE